MDINNFTQKSQKAIVEAREAASSLQHQQVHPGHLLKSIAGQTDTIVLPLFAKLGVNPGDVNSLALSELNSIPKVYGDSGEVSFSPTTIAILDAADGEKSKLKDSYISIEHILIALSGDSGAIGSGLRSLGIDPDTILGALAEVRGSQRVTSQNPEDTLAPLEQFGRDLVQLAAQGKLDPVIGVMRRFGA